MPEETRVLPSGREVTLTAPDLFAVVSAAGRVPNPLTAAVLDLLVKDGAYQPGEASPDVYIHKRDEVRGMYAVASLCLASPRLVLDRRPEEGEIGPGDLCWSDLEAIYWGWFRVRRQRPPAAAPADPGGLPGPVGNGGSLAPPAE